MTDTHTHKEKCTPTGGGGLVGHMTEVEGTHKGIMSGPHFKLITCVDLI